MKDPFTQAVWAKSFFFICQRLNYFHQLKVHHIHLATLPLITLPEEQTLARVQCLARAFVKQSRSHRSPVYTEERAPVPSKGCQCSCQALTTVREPFSPLFPSLPKVRSMKSSLSDTSNLVSGRLSGADAAV